MGAILGSFKYKIFGVEKYSDICRKNFFMEKKALKLLFLASS